MATSGGRESDGLRGGFGGGLSCRTPVVVLVGSEVGHTEGRLVGVLGQFGDRRLADGGAGEDGGCEGRLVGVDIGGEDSGR